MKSESVTTTDIDRVRRYYERAAVQYDAGMRWFERLLLGDARRGICSRAHGRTLELGVGTGLNLAFYPADVQLVGIDLSPAMLSLARERANSLRRTANLITGDAERLEFTDATFDTVIFTLSLCTIPDERRALMEAYRVLRPAGRLLLLEHVRSTVGAVRWLERLLDPLARLAGGDHLLRDPLDHLAATGFRIELCEKSKWGIIEEVVAQKEA